MVRISVVLLAAALAACTRAAPDATPEGAVRLWLDRMESATEDPRATRDAYALLGPAARANLEERAQRASRVQGRRVEPFEMLAEGRFGLKFRPKAMVTRIEPAANGVERATVEVTGHEPLTEHAIVHCARETEPREPVSPGEGGREGSRGWRVEPELPDVIALPKRGEAP
jgi:hypothetical protein